MHVRDRNCFQKPVLLIVMRFWIRILSIKWQNTTTEISQSAPMAIFGYPEIFLFTFTFSTILLTAVLRSRSWRKSSVPTNWPLVGMLPWLLRISRRVHSSVTQLMNECGGTFELKGPWFCNMDMLITSDPANIHHIFSRNFSNYPKGPEFRKIFDVLGDGIFNADFELWELHRRTTHSFFSHATFHTLLGRAVWGKVETGLLPVLDSFWKQGVAVDLQDILQRFTFDNICKLVLDYDPQSLSIDLPYVPCEKAFNGTVEALLYRHILPEGVWKLQKWLGVGKERKLIEAWKAFDEFIYPHVTLGDGEQKDDSKLLTTFRKAYEEKKHGFFPWFNHLSEGHCAKFDVRRQRYHKYVSYMAFLANCNKPLNGNQDSAGDGVQIAAEGGQELEVLQCGRVPQANLPPWSVVRVTPAVPSGGFGAQSSNCT
ncbi:UNVERIFIED_CONTAM: Alkane hydroxylase MAH1 [Sesamum angustifolium]|uniref:Alkane hydroxylase MAH1 n=1 Tax=Sesamum angustifolium TaxID=2727405 RepID=A0AAW2PCQ1_9LAMI